MSSPTKAEIETAEQLLENYILGKLPPDTTAEEYFAQALADHAEEAKKGMIDPKDFAEAALRWLKKAGKEHRKGIIEGLERSEKLAWSYCLNGDVCGIPPCRACKVAKAIRAQIAAINAAASKDA